MQQFSLFLSNPLMSRVIDLFPALARGGELGAAGGRMTVDGAALSIVAIEIGMLEADAQHAPCGLPTASLDLSDVVNQGTEGGALFVFQASAALLESLSRWATRMPRHLDDTIQEAFLFFLDGGIRRIEQLDLATREFRQQQEQARAKAQPFAPWDPIGSSAPVMPSFGDFMLGLESVKQGPSFMEGKIDETTLKRVAMLQEDGEQIIRDLHRRCEAAKALLTELGNMVTLGRETLRELRESTK